MTYFQQARFQWGGNLSLVTLTFDPDIQTLLSEDQTSLPCEFGANMLSSSPDISYTNKQTNKQKSHGQRQKQNLTQFTACGNYKNNSIN